MKMVRSGSPVCTTPDHDPTPAPALRCAVLGWDGYRWQIIFANGDEGAARTAAAAWLDQNPDSECQLMIAQPEGRAKLVTRVEWGK